MCDTEMIKIDHIDDLNDIQVADLTLTDIGRQFYREKQMPSRRRTARTEFYFNPISQKYDKKPMNSDKSDFLLEQSLFDVSDELLQNLSQREVPFQDWYTEEVTVEENGIEHDVKQEGFQVVKVQLSLDDNYHFHINSIDKLFNDWLKKRSPEIIHKHLLSPLLQKDNDILNNFFDDEIIKLDYQDDELLSLVLASGQSDLSKIQNTVPVQFSYKQQQMDKEQPAIIFSDNGDTVLKGKHLWIGAKLWIDAKLQGHEGISQLFFNMKNDDIFMEKMGYFSCYLDYQPYNLPVKILIKHQKKWFRELPEFQKPNLDILVFMANFLSSDELLQKMPNPMSLDQLDDFYQKISQTWKKNLILDQDWANKTDLISDEKGLKLFVQYFNQIPLSLQRFETTMQNQLFDLSENEQSPVYQIVELVELLKLYSILKPLDSQNLDLKNITADTLNRIQTWQNHYDELRQTYPMVLSDSLEQANNNIMEWKEKVCALFVQSSEKIAVLDTNFVRKHSKDELAGIAQNHRVILPSVVLDELDYQKEKLKRDIQVAENMVNEKTSNVQTEWNKVNELTEQIKLVNAELQKVQDTIDIVQKEAKPLRVNRQKDQPISPELKTLEQKISELVRKRKEWEEKKSALNKQKMQAEKFASQADEEQENTQNELDKLKCEGYEIREAVRKIEELALSRHSEQANKDILELLGRNAVNVPKNSDNDNIILAVALRYKLNDVVLYSKDKNLKNKAISYGIYVK